MCIRDRNNSVPIARKYFFEYLRPENATVWEVFIQSKNGLAHKHVGNVHAADKVMALENARELYTRRNEGVSIWIVPSAKITASDLNNISQTLENSENKIYRHPSFYDIPDDIGHM